MHYKKIVALFLCLAILTFSGCKNRSDVLVTSEEDKASSETSNPSAVVNMLYNSKDSLNPFTCKTNQNRVLTQLMYDSLVVLDNTYKPVYNIAKNVTYKDKVLTVNLNSLKFSDGTAVTAQDVVFSFNTAKKDSASYSSSLKYFSSAKATDNITVVFSLLRHDPYSVNLLTFPIIKYGSDTLKDSDNRALPPVGCGRYVLNNEEKKLVKNDYHSGSYAVSSVRLIDCPDSESMNQTVSSGAVDYYYTDLSDNVVPKMNGTSANFPQSRIVFLGVNSTNSVLSNMYFRQAVSSAINRKEICNTAYFSKAIAANGPFFPKWEEAANYQTIPTEPKSDTVLSNLKNAGIVEKDDDGFYLLKNGKRVTLTLLMSSGNTCRESAAKIIKANLESVGIEVNINSVEKSKFYASLSAGRYDLYLGEIKFENNMDLGGLVKLESAKSLIAATGTSSLVSFNETATSSALPSNETSSKETSSPVSGSSNSLTSSAATSSESVPEITLTTEEAYKGFYSGIYNIQDIITAFSAELPIIPLAFRDGLVIYSEKLGSGVKPTVTDVFYGIENLK